MWGPVVCHGDRQGREIALSFDDGPTPGITEAILEILSRSGLRATFFVIGQNAQNHPELIRRLHSEGHIIANHTWHHHHHGWARWRKYWELEIKRTDDLIEEIVGVRPAYFRPPVGLKTWCTLSAARRLGHATITWSCRGRDGVCADVNRILDRLNGVRGGDIVLLHDGIDPNFSRDPSGTIAALPIFLDRLARLKLVPVPMDRLLQIPAYASG